MLAILLCGSGLAISAQMHEAHADAHAAADHGDHHGDDLTLWKVANFAILAGALGWAAVRKGGPYFRSRTTEIQKGIAEAARVRQEAEARAAEIERRIAGLAADVETLRRTSREEMAGEGERIQAETAQLLARISSQAEQEIASAGKLARRELRAYSVDLAIEIATQRVHDRMSPQTQESLVGSFVRDLEKKRARREVQ